jgi:uncharacterized protein YjbI with pentapeptide repeats
MDMSYTRGTGRISRIALVSILGIAALILAFAPASSAARTKYRQHCHARRNANLRKCDFSGANLRKVSLRNSNLSGANLSHTDLVGADLRRANLTRARLAGANISGARVSRANFHGASLRGIRSGHLRGNAELPKTWVQRYGLLFGPRANLSGTNLDSLPLDHLDLAGANLNRATLRGASLIGSDLTRAQLAAAIAPGANAATADLAGANLKGGSWRNATMADANLTQADLESADLTGAVFTGAQVTDADFAGATLSSLGTGGLVGQTSSLPAGWLDANGYLVGPQADLGDAQLTGQNLANADLAESVLPNANLKSSHLGSAALSHSDLLDTNMVDSTLSAQALSGASITGAQMAGASISGPDGTSVNGAPESLPAGWALSDNRLVSVPSAIASGSTFAQGQWIESPNGQFTVNMQADGNLVEYQGGTAIWASGTSGAVATVMQSDCNLVIYNASQVGQPAGALYTTGTGGDPSGNCSFSVANDGSLAVATSTGVVRWARYANGTLYSHRITMTQNAPVYSGPSASSSQISTIPQGNSPDYVCWTTGPKVGTVDVYFYVLWQGGAGYYPSYYDSSTYAADSRISIDYGIPRCGSVPTTFTPPSNGTIVPAGPSTISAPIDVVTNTSIRVGPSDSSGAALASMPAGTNPGFLCWTKGEVVNNVDVWFKVYWGGVTGYYASGLDNSTYSNDLAITGKYGIPYCGGGSGPVAPVSVPTAPPMSGSSGSGGSTGTSAPATGPVINTPQGGDAQVRTCESSGCPYVQYADGSDITLPDGHPVSMLCWVDSNLVGGLVTTDGPKSARWFAVYAYTGAYAPVYGWTFSDNVQNQIRVPNCTDPTFVADNQWAAPYILTGGLAREPTCKAKKMPTPCGLPARATAARVAPGERALVTIAPNKAVPQIWRHGALRPPAASVRRLRGSVPGGRVPAS